MEQFEEQIHSDLQQYLRGMKEVDERLQESPDIENKGRKSRMRISPTECVSFRTILLRRSGG